MERVHLLMVILNVEILQIFGILIAEEPGGTDIVGGRTSGLDPYFTIQQVVEFARLQIAGEKWHETKDHRPWWGKAEEFA
jgi:hypothetical protein